MRHTSSLGFDRPLLALCFASALALILACLSRGDADPGPTISARELLLLTQASTGANYTYDQETAKLLAEVSVPRPAAANFPSR